MIPYGRHDINPDDINAVIEVLQSDFLTQGPTVPAFEKSIANFCHAKHAIAVNSATSALHLACLALGVSDRDVVWTTPISFVASANCALYCGAKVDFVDIEPDTYNLSVDRLVDKLEYAKKNNALPKVVIPVHFAGQSCDMERIYKLSQQYDFKVIEDASHSIGGRYKEEFIGSCRYSDITVFSFHPVKIITTGEGGMALTNDSEIEKKIRLLRSHGITRDSLEMNRKSEGPWYYQQVDLGFNYRMTDIQAALGMSQMKRLNEYVTNRHVLAKYYDEKLSGLPLIKPWQHLDNYSSYHLYVIRLKLDLISKSHREVFEALHNAGIGVNVHYIPIHLQPYFQQMGFKSGDFPEAEKYYSEAISLPIYPTLTKEEQDKVVITIKQVLSE